MKKCLAIILVFCVTMVFNVSFAVNTKSFSMELPNDFKLIEQEEGSAEYSNDKITITYMIKTSEPGEYFLDVKDIKSELSSPLTGLAFLLLGLGRDATLVEINNEELLKSVSEYENSKTITYLGTSAKNMTIIKFSGEELNETEVENIVASLDLKGMSGKTYQLLMNLLMYAGGAFLIIGLPLIFKFLKAKRQAKKTSEVVSNMENLDMNQISQDEVDYSVDNYNQEIKDEWKL